MEPDGNAGRRADSRDAPYKQARTLLVLAESRGRASDTAGEAAALDEVRNLCALLSAEATATRPSPPAGLTAREGEVLRHIAAGESNREIAEALSVSVRTINRHIENLYQKIGVHGRAEATAYAYRHHLV